MAKTRTAKISAHDALTDHLQRMKSVLFIGYAGLTVKDMTTLRNTFRTAGVSMVAAKKTVLRRALQTAKLDPTPVDALSGELALVFGFDDEVTPAKLAAAFAKTNEALVMKGAFVDGQFIDQAAVKALAKLPGRDELRAKLVWIIGSPMSGLVNVGSGLLRSLVQVLQAHRQRLSGQTS